MSKICSTCDLPKDSSYYGKEARTSDQYLYPTCPCAAPEHEASDPITRAEKFLHDREVPDEIFIYNNLDLMTGFARLENKVCHESMTTDEETEADMSDGVTKAISDMKQMPGALDTLKALADSPYGNPVEREATAAVLASHAQLLAETLRLRQEVERLNESNRFVVSPDHVKNLIECVKDELFIQLGAISPDPDSEPDEFIPNKIGSVIDEWFMTLGEDQTVGLPEYENHRC